MNSNNIERLNYIENSILKNEIIDNEFINIDVLYEVKNKILNHYNINNIFDVYPFTLDNIKSHIDHAIKLNLNRNLSIIANKIKIFDLVLKVSIQRHVDKIKFYIDNKDNVNCYGFTLEFSLYTKSMIRIGRLLFNNRISNSFTFECHTQENESIDYRNLYSNLNDRDSFFYTFDENTEQDIYLERKVMLDRQQPYIKYNKKLFNKYENFINYLKHDLLIYNNYIQWFSIYEQYYKIIDARIYINFSIGFDDYIDLEMKSLNNKEFYGSTDTRLLIDYKNNFNKYNLLDFQHLGLIGSKIFEQKIKFPITDLGELFNLCKLLDY